MDELGADNAIKMLYGAGSLATIEKVFAYNIKRLRGDLTQEVMAERLGIPLRSYQHIEKGAIPKPKTRKAIAAKLGIPESALFLDPDLSSPSAEQFFEILLNALTDPEFRESCEDAMRTYLELRRPRKSAK